MPHIVPVREYQSVAEMQAHAAAVKARMFAPRPRALPVAELVVEASVEKTVLPSDWEQFVERSYAEHERIALPDTTAQRQGRAVCRGADVTRAVHRATGMYVSAIAGPSRIVAVVKARQIAMWLLVHRAGKSLPQAGAILGGRDHTTALHSVRRVDGVIAALRLSPVEDPEAMASLLWAAVWPKGYIARPRS